MNEQFAAALRDLPNFMASHVLISATAMVLGLLVSLPLAVIASRNRPVRVSVLAIAGLVQTIPSLALLALFYPLLLAASALTQASFGTIIPALGFLPSVLALTLYAILPILRNGVTGLMGVDPKVIEAANGVGMTVRQRLIQVEVPLAAPVVMAGVRTATVWTIGAATLATSVGQTSLGNYIFSGLQTENWVLVLFGCAAATLLAIVADQLLGLIETGLVQGRRSYWMTGVIGLAVGTALALVPLVGSGAGPKGQSYVIGAKNFSEQFILAEVISARLVAGGSRVTRKDSLGSAVAFRALAAGDLDAYVDYSGTLWTNVLGRTDVLPRLELLAALKRALLERHGVVMLGSLGFENAYVLAMDGQAAASGGITSIADLASKAPQLTLGSDLEFLSRPEWLALKTAYGLNFGGEKSYSPTFMYRALQTKAVDVISAFSSDGRIAANTLTVLTDPKGAAPSYDAVILIAPARANDAALLKALAPLIGAISVERMREANLRVDRDEAKATPKEAAAFLASGLPAVEPSSPTNKP
jgi:osmoprotectant transport system permease protein